MANDVVELMNELEINKSHIVGMSMGGLVAQLVALNFSDRGFSLTCIATTPGSPNLPPSIKEVQDFL